VALGTYLLVQGLLATPGGIIEAECVPAVVLDIGIAVESIDVLGRGETNKNISALEMVRALSGRLGVVFCESVYRGLEIDGMDLGVLEASRLKVEAGLDGAISVADGDGGVEVIEDRDFFGLDREKRISDQGVRLFERKRQEVLAAAKRDEAMVAATRRAKEVADFYGEEAERYLATTFGPWNLENPDREELMAMAKNKGLDGQGLCALVAVVTAMGSRVDRVSVIKEVDGWLDQQRIILTRTDPGQAMLALAEAYGTLKGTKSNSIRILEWAEVLAGRVLETNLVELAGNELKRLRQELEVRREKEVGALASKIERKLADLVDEISRAVKWGNGALVDLALDRWSQERLGRGEWPVDHNPENGDFEVAGAWGKRAEFWMIQAIQANARPLHDEDDNMTWNTRQERRLWWKAV